MSSMRNAVQRRNHKERAQPLEREKWGLLEKRKDYKLRAADHKQKKTKLKLLKQKALERNPDEFSFRMMSSTVDKHGRRVQDRGNQALSMEVVKLLKTQDANYIRTQLQLARKEREGLEQKIMLEGDEVTAFKGGKNGKHTVFVDDREQQRKFKADNWFGRGEDMPVKEKESAAWEDSDEEGWETVQKKKKSKKQEEAEKLAEKEKKRMERMRERNMERLEIHLEAVKRREKELATAEEELEKQRAKMNNTIGGVNKNGVKFKIRERKR